MSWLKLFQGKTDKIMFEGRDLVEKSRSIGLMSDTVMRYIAVVKSGKRSIILGKDFVVMSRREYDKLCNK